ncbi:MAG TPA: type II toxin-antitoxin system PemK/MazF family toxin [Ornithinibacter sp.]|nr:type II toxin-antitoxin system PemK/MazF family toxin [Ornithinibacter sp.]
MPSAPRTSPSLLTRLRAWLVRRRAVEPGYPGDFTGRLSPEYSPRPDGRPDPGEVVWTWVPFEEDHTRGKDRPVLLVGRDGPWLLALQLTSKDHDGHPASGRGRGPRWVDVGTGAWDRQRRPSEVRVDRVVRVDPRTIRREGAVLSPDRFAAVAEVVARRGA